jgi:hypothetical protein
MMSHCSPARQGCTVPPMIFIGLVLLIVGLLVAKLSILFIIGIVLVVIGVVLELAAGSGRLLGGRRHWY